MKLLKLFCKSKIWKSVLFSVLECKWVWKERTDVAVTWTALIQSNNKQIKYFHWINSKYRQNHLKPATGNVCTFLKSSDQLVYWLTQPPLILSLPLPCDVLDEVFTFCLWHVSHGTVSLSKFWLHVHPQENQSWRNWQSWRACHKIWWVYILWTVRD